MINLYFFSGRMNRLRHYHLAAEAGVKEAGRKADNQLTSFALSKKYLDND